MSYARIIAAGPIVDEQSWDAISVEAVEVAGEITGASIYDYTDDVMHYHTDFPVSIPLGNLVDLSAYGENTGVADQRMAITVQLLDPHGNVRGEKIETMVRAPGEVVISGPTPQVILDEPGTWVAYIKLEAELL